MLILLTFATITQSIMRIIFKEEFIMSKKLVTGGISKGQGILLTGLAMMGLDKLSKGIAKKNQEEKVIGYDDAIRAIMNSSMFGSDKQKRVELVKFGQNPEYYNAIISIMHASLFGSERIKSIKSINSNLEETQV